MRAVLRALDGGGEFSPHARQLLGKARGEILVRIVEGAVHAEIRYGDDLQRGAAEAGQIDRGRPARCARLALLRDKQRPARGQVERLDADRAAGLGERAGQLRRQPIVAAPVADRRLPDHHREPAAQTIPQGEHGAGGFAGGLAGAFGAVGGLGDGRHLFGDGPHEIGGFLRGFADGARGFHLLADGLCNRGEARQDLADHADDAVDGTDTPLRRGLQAGDIGDDLVGGGLGLDRQRLHLVGDDRKSPPGLAGTSRLDGGIEGEQVGLLGDVGDQADDIGDVVDGAFQLLDAGVGRVGDLTRFLGQTRGIPHLSVDFVACRDETFDRGGELLGGLVGVARLAVQRLGMAADIRQQQQLLADAGAQVFRARADAAGGGAQIRLDEIERQGGLLVAGERERGAGRDVPVGLCLGPVLSCSGLSL